MSYKNPNFNEFYTYIYLDPRKPGNYKYGKYKFEYEPFYVGKGFGNRLTKHLYEHKYSEKVNKINRIFEETGQIPIILKVKEGLTERQALDLEIELIAIIGRNKNWTIKQGPLVNQTNGGETSSGYKHTEDAKKNIKEHNRNQVRLKCVGEKISKALKGKYTGKNNKHSGKILSDETRTKIRRKLQGVEFTEERRKNISNNTKLAMPNRREFEVYKNNILIAKYLSTKDMKHSEHHITRKNINECIKMGKLNYNEFEYKFTGFGGDNSEGIYTV